LLKICKSLVRVNNYNDDCACCRGACQRLDRFFESKVRAVLFPSALTQTDGAAEAPPSLMPAGINLAGSRGGNATVMVAAESFERVSGLGSLGHKLVWRRELCVGPTTTQYAALI
jgi:hypothetical protein